MGITSNIQNITGIITVQIEGFFTERFINLCRINNIKIWDIRNIVKGVIRFKMQISDFKKLRSIAKKTKCKVSIKEKKGLYFTLFKYRKRKLVFVLFFLIIIFSIAFSTFIWDIDVVGNETLSNEQIISVLKESGLYIGRNKIGLDKKEIVNEFRAKELELSWVGIEIDGTRAIVKIVEKTRMDEKNVQQTNIGDIVATKSGVITKIVAENGTSKYKALDYVDKGNVIIEGNVYDRNQEIIGEVPAKGYARVDNIYTFEKDYLYTETIKEYTDKKRITFGITINSKENMINYLNKSKKYDITKNSKNFKLLGNTISLDMYECREYNEINVNRTKEEIEQIANSDMEEFLNNSILKECVNPTVIDKTKNMYDIQDGIKVKVEYVINEQIGEFVERGN